MGLSGHRRRTVSNARGPDNLTMEMAPGPGGVLHATIVSIMSFYELRQSRFVGIGRPGRQSARGLRPSWPEMPYRRREARFFFRWRGGLSSVLGSSSSTTAAGLGAWALAFLRSLAIQNCCGSVAMLAVA